MDKQEAIERVNELTTTVALKGSGMQVLIDQQAVLEVIDQIHEPQKVVVPKFVAEWIEKTKSVGWSFKVALNNPTDSVCEWLADRDNQETFARAWLDGFDIEQEKLYTVELPNPNNIGTEVHVLRMNGFKQVVIKKELGNDWEKKKGFQLTEAEIKQDFEWAWQWAEPVEVY